MLPAIFLERRSCSFCPFCSLGPLDCVGSLGISWALLCCPVLGVPELLGIIQLSGLNTAKSSTRVPWEFVLLTFGGAKGRKSSNFHQALGALAGQRQKVLKFMSLLSFAGAKAIESKFQTYCFVEFQSKAIKSSNRALGYIFGYFWRKGQKLSKLRPSHCTQFGLVAWALFDRFAN